MATELKIAINLIEYSHGKKRMTAEPGVPFLCPTSEVDYLSREGAIRDLTDAELALWERQNGGNASQDVEGDGSGDEKADPSAAGRGRARSSAKI